MISKEIGEISLIILSLIGGISLLAGFVLSAFDFSFRAVNRFIVELDSREGEKYPETLNYFFKNREQYNTSIVWGKSAYGFGFVVISTLILQTRLSAFIIIVGVLFLAFEILPRIIALFSPGFFVEKTYWGAKANFYFYKRIFIKNVKTPADFDDISGSEEENVENEEMEIFKNALNLPEVKLRECLIPRTEICAVPSNISRTELLNKFIETKYSRIIVYEGSIDKISGYVHTRDLLCSEEKSVKSLVRLVEYFTEEMSAKDLLSRMIKNKNSLCVVLDEYGGTSGIVTLEDLIEEIFGEIKDEHDKEELQERVIGQGEYIFSGRLEIKYLNREYELNLPEEEEYETLGGFIIYIKENIPLEGEVINIEGYDMKILKIRNNSIASVYIRILG